MLIYMAVPVLIMVGLCIFFYMAGRYVRIGKKREGIKVPEIIKEQEYPKKPDRAPILEEEIRKLKEALKIKNIDMEEQSRAAESVMQENRKLLAQTRQDKIDMIDELREEVEEAIKFKASLSQFEKESTANNIAATPAFPSYEDMLKEPEDKAVRKKPKDKSRRKPRRKK